MDITLSPKHINEILEDLKKGLTCHVHCRTGHIISFPQINLADFGEEDQWYDSRKKVEENWVDYLVIVPPPANEILKIMGTFAGLVQEEEGRNDLLKSLESDHPSRSFKKALHDYPEIRKDWYQYKDQYLREWIQVHLSA